MSGFSRRMTDIINYYQYGSNPGLRGRLPQERVNAGIGGVGRPGFGEPGVSQMRRTLIPLLARQGRYQTRVRTEILRQMSLTGSSVTEYVTTFSGRCNTDAAQAQQDMTLSKSPATITLPANGLLIGHVWFEATHNFDNQVTDNSMDFYVCPNVGGTVGPLGPNMPHYIPNITAGGFPTVYTLFPSWYSAQAAVELSGVEPGDYDVTLGLDFLKSGGWANKYIDVSGTMYILAVG